MEWLADNPGKRVLIMVHTQELLDQALAKLRSVAPGLRVGAVQAHRNETLARVVVATVQTLRNERRRAMLRDVGLIIVDEAHHAVATSYARQSSITSACWDWRPARAPARSAWASRRP